MCIKLSIAQVKKEMKNEMAATKLKEAIEKSGLKQKFIAEKVGISETALSSMLNGNQKIDVDTFFAIAVILRMTPDEIYGFRKGA